MERDDQKIKFAALIDRKKTDKLVMGRLSRRTITRKLTEYGIISKYALRSLCYQKKNVKDRLNFAEKYDNIDAKLFERIMSKDFAFIVIRRNVVLDHVKTIARMFENKW